MGTGSGSGQQGWHLCEPFVVRFFSEFQHFLVRGGVWVHLSGWVRVCQRAGLGPQPCQGLGTHSSCLNTGMLAFGWEKLMFSSVTGHGGTSRGNKGAGSVCGVQHV